jgi:glycosyltransferase involved in cell wall biosynthesis
VSVVVTPTLRTKHLDTITHTLTSTLHAMRSGAEVIHYHGVGPSLLSWVPRIFASQIRVVATFHSVDREHQKWGLFARLVLGLGERAACRFPHEVIAVSRALKEYCRARYDCGARYVPNGVDVSRVKPDNKPLESFGLEKGEYLISTGRLIPVKGFHHLIKAFRALKKKKQTRGFKLAIVGGSSYSDSYVNRLRRLAGRDEDVVFTGFVSGEPLESLIAGSYAAVQPSEVEGLSLSVLEAMAHGKAVLASDIPGNREALGEHGLYFDPADVTDLTQQLKVLLSDKKLAAGLGAESREHVMAHYDWDEIAAATDEIYRGVSLRRPSKSMGHLAGLAVLGVVALIAYFLFFDKE